MPDAPFQDGPDGWARPALRSVGVMVLVMGGIVGAGVSAMAAWAADHPPYQDAVLTPAQEKLTQDQEQIRRAQAAALAGDFSGARAILEQVREGQSEFVQRILAAGTPRSPELKPVHVALLGLYANMGAGLDAVITCMDDLQAGNALAGFTVCAQGQAALAQASDQAQAIADRIATLVQELAS